MMRASKESEKKRHQERSAKRASRDLIATQAFPTWEKDILPNWKATLRDEALRRIWWSGTMPARHRARLWQGCIGNGLALGKGE